MKEGSEILYPIRSVYTDEIVGLVAGVKRYEERNEKVKGLPNRFLVHCVEVLVDLMGGKMQDQRCAQVLRIDDLSVWKAALQ